MKKVVISIVNYKNAKDTMSCIASLEKVIQKNFVVEVIVSNNDKEDFLMSENSKWKLPVTIINNKKNLGFSGGHNVAIKKALQHNASYVLVLNNDTIIDPMLVSALVQAAEENMQVGIVVPKIYFAKGSEFHKDRYKKDELGKVIWYAGGILDMNNIIGKHRGVDEVDNGQFDITEETDTATGCCMLVKRDVFEKVGLFDERYFLYYEDSDLSMRVRRAGYTILYEPKGILWHINAGAAGGSGSPLQDYFISRNRMLFGMTYGNQKTKVALFRESIRLLRSGRIEQKHGIRDYYRRKFYAGAYAV